MAQKTTTSLPTIGDVIRAWRDFHGLRSTELAALAGVRSQYLSEIEHNRTANPREEFLKKLAVPLKITLRDIYARQMPPEDGGAQPTPNSKQGVAGQGSQQVSPDEDERSEAEEEEESGSSAATYNTARSAIRTPDSLFDTSKDKIERVKQFITTLSLTGEEDEVVASQLDTTLQLLKFIAAQRMMQKKG
jgi:transcriptional regulator with XRE-family HTH domain